MPPLIARRPADVHVRSGPQMREYQSIANRLGRERPGRLLDWGCGLGQVTRLLLDEGLDVTAFDYRPDLETEGVFPLERQPEIEAHLSPDPVRLPFDDDAFDALLSCGVLEHVARPDDSLEELRRVLRPGGTFYVYKLPNRFSYLERIAKVGGLYYHGALPDDRVYGKREALDLLGRHGYEVVEFRRANMLPLTLRSRLAARLTEPIWAVNRALARLPGLSLAATNLELVARAPR